MAKQTLITIKNWFRTGLKPTQQQFLDAWDSFRHKETLIPAGSIENLDARFDEKADTESFSSHTNDMHAHGLDRKADLDRSNKFTAANTFQKPLQTKSLLTSTGIAFNLDVNGQRIENGLYGKLSFQSQNGNLSFLTGNTIQEGISTPVFESAFTSTHSGDLILAGVQAKALELRAENGFTQQLHSSQTAPASAVNLAMPASNGTIARTEDLPVVTGGTRITIKSVPSGVEISAVPAEGGLISITYSALIGLINSKTLQPGRQYVITDFRSTMRYALYTVSTADNSGTLTCDTDTYNGDIEPLMVTALSNDKLQRLAIPVSRPQDLLIYTTDNINAGILASTRGTILKRTDTRNNNTANFDYRQTRYRYADNKSQSYQALILGSNCKIDALDDSGALMPLVISLMDNSWIKSTSGDFINSIEKSRIDLGKGRICSNYTKFMNCDLKGDFFQLNQNAIRPFVNINNLYARVGKVLEPVNDLLAEIWLSNSTTALKLVQGSDYSSHHSFFVQKNGPDGVTLSPMYTPT